MAEDFPTGYEIAEAHVPPGPEAIASHVAGFKRRFDESPSYEPVLRAFEYIAVARRHGYQWFGEGALTDLKPLDDETGVLVPWWALNALVGALQAARNQKVSLDKVMGLAGDGSGKSSIWHRYDEAALHLKRAYEVAWLIQNQGMSQADAVASVAEREGVSDSQIKKDLAASKALGFRAPPAKRGRRTPK